MNKADIDTLNSQIPKYEYVEIEGETEVALIKRTIAKLQETATTFNLYDVYTAISHIDKRNADLQVEIDINNKNKALFEAEIELIEKALGIDNPLQMYADAKIAEKTPVAPVEALPADVTAE